MATALCSRATRPSLVAIVVAMLVLTGCFTPATRSVAPAPETVNLTTVTPTATAVPSPTATTLPRPTSLPLPTPTPDPWPQTRLLGMSRDARFAYGARYFAEPECGEIPTTTLVGVDVAASIEARGHAVEFEAGLTLMGEVLHVGFGVPGRLVIVASCSSPAGEAATWMQTVEIDADGKVSSMGNRYDGEYRPYTDEFVTDAGVRSTETGELVAPDEVVPVRFTSPDGAFTYTIVNDPRRGWGCEEIADTTTFAVDDGSGPRLALGSDGLDVPWVSDAFVVDDVVVWSSSADCESGRSRTVSLGRIGADGAIRDAHHVDPRLPDILHLRGGPVGEGNPQYDRFYWHFGLTADGLLVGVNQDYRRLDLWGELWIGFMVYDLSTDPFFISSAGNLGVDEDGPSAPTLAGTGSWYVVDPARVWCTHARSRNVDRVR